MPACQQDFLNVFRGLPTFLTVELHQLGKTENRVQRRTQLMTHAGDESRLRQVRCLCFVGRRAQVTFNVLEIIDVHMSTGQQQYLAGSRILLKDTATAEQPVIHPLSISKPEFRSILCAAAQSRLLRAQDSGSIIGVNPGAEHVQRHTPDWQPEALAKAPAQLYFPVTDVPLPDALGGTVEHQLNTLLGGTIEFLTALQLQSNFMGVARHAVEFSDFRVHRLRAPALGTDVCHHSRYPFNRNQQPLRQPSGPNPEKRKEHHIEGDQTGDQQHAYLSIVARHLIGLSKQQLFIHDRQQLPAGLLDFGPTHQ